MVLPFVAEVIPTSKDVYEPDSDLNTGSAHLNEYAFVTTSEEFYPSFMVAALTVTFPSRTIVVEY